MRPSELRIGNYLYDKQSNPIPLKSFLSLCIVEANLHKYKPIPLTEEWLVKFGFYIDKVKAYINYGELNSMFQLNRIGNDFEFTLGALPVKHVHQLQNLYFALTSEELTIK